jgi:hypothetical protein
MYCGAPVRRSWTGKRKTARTIAGAWLMAYGKWLTATVGAFGTYSGSGSALYPGLNILNIWSIIGRNYSTGLLDMMTIAMFWAT